MEAESVGLLCLASVTDVMGKGWDCGEEAKLQGTPTSLEA